ncbi:peroxiredoxin [Eisenibacter elegans]|jgi:peroxiredoxin Q/BCP|uniref:peroxiredoxin n=1 Tax=Eisenibacter elegans TaxID=997 RepID=UPI00041A2FB1|nr:peroxiredoxin [Eisenibacter elegans]
MALTINTPAPDFRLPSTAGSDFQLSEALRGKALILYFYPKDFTPLCTVETCIFRDTFEFFNNLGVAVVGISTDDLETHHRFIEAHNIPFPLLADVDGRVASSYDAFDPLIKFTRRITYLIDGQGMIRAVYANVFKDEKDLRKMIESLQKESQAL